MIVDGHDPVPALTIVGPLRFLSKPSIVSVPLEVTVPLPSIEPPPPCSVVVTSRAPLSTRAPALNSRTGVSMEAASSESVPPATCMAPVSA